MEIVRCRVWGSLFSRRVAGSPAAHPRHVGCKGMKAKIPEYMFDSVTGGEDEKSELLPPARGVGLNLNKLHFDGIIKKNI